MFKKLLGVFLLWRIVLFAPLFVPMQYIAIRKGYEYTVFSFFLKNISPIKEFWLTPWANFDGVYYLIIGISGYTVNGGFFPLLPLLVHIVAFLTGNNTQFVPIQYYILLVLMTIFAFLSIYMLYKLVKLDYSDSIAWWTVVLLLCFPMSFFLPAIYTEGPFLLLAILSFYFARKNKWLLASIFGLLLGASRIVGIAILPALLLEFILEEKVIQNRKIIWKNLLKGWSLLLTPLGLFGYMVYNVMKWGNALYFVQAQGSFKNNRTVDHIVFFPQTIYRYVRILMTVNPHQFEWSVALLEFSVFIFASVLFIIAWKKRVRWSYLLFALLCFLLPVSSGTFTGLPRYVLVLFPLFIGFALVKNKWIKILYCVVGFVLLLLFFLLFSRGYFLA